MNLRNATLSLVSDDGFHDVIITHSTRAAAERTYEALEGGMTRFLARRLGDAAFVAIVLFLATEGPMLAHVAWSKLKRRGHGG